MNAITPGVVIQIDLGDLARVGCGTRRYLVIKVGRVNVDLLYPANLKRITVTLADVARHGGIVEEPTRKLTTIIKANRRERKRLGLAWSKPATEAALGLLWRAS